MRDSYSFSLIVLLQDRSSTVINSGSGQQREDKPCFLKNRIFFVFFLLHYLFFTLFRFQECIMMISYSFFFTYYALHMFKRGNCSQKRYFLLALSKKANVLEA
jgi:hypothetical protein